jgi:hypothetical protein
MPSFFKKLASAAKAFDSTLTRIDSTISREISALTRDDATGTGTRDEMYGPPGTATFEVPKSFETPGCRGCMQRISERSSGERLSALKKSYAEDNCLYCSLVFQGLLHLIPDLETRFGQDAVVGRVVGRGPDRTLKMYADPNGSLRGTELPETVLLEYEYYIAGGRFPQRQEPPSTSSEECFQRARQWISDCFKNHALCGGDKPSLLPTRILDVGEGPTADPTYVKLIEAPGRKERYIALSHCWGGTQPLTTTAATLSAHKGGIAFDCLPKTFQDAVRITRRLGIRYLWIDSLCIIQDSAEDWQMEASRMALVYRNSWLTVSATLSSSPTTGCFSSNQATTVQATNDNTLAVLFPDAVKLRQALRLCLRFPRMHPDLGQYARERDNEPFPLLSRAWAYQERLLAPRVLHFGPQELFWECMQNLDCECGTLKWSGAQHMSGYMSRDTSGQLPPKISHYAALHVGGAGNYYNDTLPQQKLLSRWGDMVTEFTKRNLTFATDRLPAFSGVAAEMAERLPMQYCAGLWRETLPVGLLWQLSGSIQKAPSIGEPLAAPSWSWAAANAPVQYNVFPSPRWEESATVEDVHCVPLGKDPRGELRVAESYLVLSAEIVQGLLCFEPASRTYEGPWMYVGDAIEKGVKSPTNSRAFRVKVGDKTPTSFTLDRKLWGREGGWIWQVTDELYCAKIGKEGILHYWLVLRRGKGESTYERIGICQADWASPEPKQRITIR